MSDGPSDFEMSTAWRRKTQPARQDQGLMMSLRAPSHRALLAGVVIGLFTLAPTATTQTFAAPAAPAPVAPELMRFVEQPANRQTVLAMIQDQATRLLGACKSLSFANDHVAVAIAPRFNANGTPLHGEWKESWTATGCGKSKIFNVETFTRDNGAVSRLLLVPGTTIAPPGLQSDALLHAVTAANAPSGGCQDRTILDTAFLGFAAAAAPGNGPSPQVRPWHEDWTVDACGKVSVVMLHFTPDDSASGIRVTADARPEK